MTVSLKGSMEVFKITGGTPLHGSVRIGGAKNASYKLMIASLLAKGESRLLNFSHISDVATVLQIITELGGSARRTGERAIFINPDTLTNWQLDPSVGQQGRFSTLFIPILLARVGKAVVPAPGGDKIGKRPLERHFDGLEALGATVREENGMFIAETNGLRGARYKFKKNTHTGTETLLLAAVLATGTTLLENAALESEVDDLIAFLNAMGAKIQRLPDKCIEIIGVPELQGAIYKIMPDRNEAVSYACAALVTKGDVIIENARPEHLTAFLSALDAINAGYEVGSYGIRFYYKGPLNATDITTAMDPGFMTDWQPLFATVLTQAEGVSTIHETVMEKRFQYVTELQAMGAEIRQFQPEVADRDATYNFNLLDADPSLQHAIAITGPVALHAGNFAVHDLRHGATLILAALAATGTSHIAGVEHVDRGYEALAERLKSMGAAIERTTIEHL